ncbi:methionine ABC transporter permease [Bacillus pseudomycoides]|uniref:methionine ABC transporter permease n=1 Tax=Bacillus pseudomycoides TaxID=64104 RepID=UPI0005040B1E|nr:methionine ABC transporter permease [Bacillus pseudomycoides]KFN14030.1 binding--dependent transport system inner membrane component family protein [Bacillus pseudomycoides]MDR4189720.1 ABC transporter permease [Bacillus pseudomycoides]MED0856636.1 ABC transporter permease [Bacillus pseudomycoides]
MFNNVIPLLPEIWTSLLQTLLMVGLSVGVAIILGVPLGVILYFTSKGQILEQNIVHRILNGIVNIIRSFPFIILLVALVPLTRTLLGTTIGPIAATIPLSVAAIPYFARLVEQALREVPKGVIEAAEAMGATPLQIVWKVLLVEARSGLVLSLTVLTVSFISYSAMAGVVGGGGVGDLAIRFGYYRFQTDVMIVTVLMLVILVQSVQFIGNRIAAKIDKR